MCFILVKFVLVAGSYSGTKVRMGCYFLFLVLGTFGKKIWKIRDGHS